MTAAARYFCAAGYAFLRFNPRGRWPSGGKYVNHGVLDQAHDTSMAIRYLKSRGYKKVGLIGHSMGGLAGIILRGKGTRRHGAVGARRRQDVTIVSF